MKTARFVFTLFVLFAMLTGCKTSEKKYVSMDITFPKVSENPASYEQAYRERQKLLARITELISAMTGDNFISKKSPLLAAIARDYYRIQQGIARLEAEKADYGLSFYQDINDMLNALRRHLELLYLMRNKLEFVPEAILSERQTTSKTQASSETQATSNPKTQRQNTSKSKSQTQN